LLLQELPHGRADTVIEAAEDGGVGYVLVGGRIEMEDLLHEPRAGFILMVELFRPSFRTVWRTPASET